MFPEYTESTPLLAASNASAVSSQGDTDHDAADLREQQHRTHTHFASSYRRPSFVTGGSRGLLIPSSPIPESALRDDEVFDCVREETELLKENSIIPVGTGTGGGRRGSITANTVADVEETWEEAVKGGKIKTSWRHELGVLARYSVFPRA
jgi:hypothetical protein